MVTVHWDHWDHEHEMSKTLNFKGRVEWDSVLDAISDTKTGGIFMPQTRHDCMNKLNLSVVEGWLGAGSQVEYLGNDPDGFLIQNDIVTYTTTLRMSACYVIVVGWWW